MRNLPVLLLSVLSIALAGVAWNSHRQHVTLRGQVATLKKSLAARDAVIADIRQSGEKLEQQNKVFTEESTALREKLAQNPVQLASVSEPAAEPTATPTDEKKNPFGGMMEKMMKNPKMLDAIAAQQMAVLKPMYADLVKQLQLTPEEAKQFFDVLSAQTAKAMQAGMKMMSGDKKAADEIKNSQEEMKAFLGDRYPQYETYQKSLPDRMQLSQINSQMAARQTPLRLDQSNGLLQIMQQEKLNTAKFTKANTDPQNTQFTDGIVTDTVAATEERNARILARSKTLLSPEQWNAFAEQQKQTLQMHKMGMEMARGMFAQPETNPAK